MRRITVFLIIGAFLIGIASQANAAPELRLGIASEKPDNTAVLNLNLSNGGTTKYAGMNAKILLPKGITVTGVSRGELLPSDKFTLDWKTLSTTLNDGVTVIAYSGTNTFTGNGKLLSLNLAVSSTVAANTSLPVIFASDSGFINSKYALSDENGISVALTPRSGFVAVGHSDSNANGMPDSLDQIIVNANTDDSIASISQVLPGDDFDGDGISNQAEFFAGTNPIDPTDKSGGCGSSLKGNINCDQNVGLEDVILGLRVVSGITTGTENVNLGADVNGDNKIGLQDVIYALQVVAGLR